MPAMSKANPVSPAPADPLVAARDAMARHAWPEAFDRLSQADREGDLSGADLEALALAAFFAAHADVELEVRERAFRAYEAEGDTPKAAFIAMGIARSYGYAGKHSIASGWTRRAERIIGAEGDTYLHGYLALLGARPRPHRATSRPRSPLPSGLWRSATAPPTPT